MSACPNCGHCSHCKRPAPWPWIYPTHPTPTYPTYPTPMWTHPTTPTWTAFPPNTTTSGTGG